MKKIFVSNEKKRRVEKMLRHKTNIPAPAGLSDDELIFKAKNACGNCTPFFLSFFVLMREGAFNGNELYGFSK
jgi:hypothetical protein